MKQNSLGELSEKTTRVMLFLPEQCTRYSGASQWACNPKGARCPCSSGRSWHDVGFQKFAQARRLDGTSWAARSFRLLPWRSVSRRCCWNKTGLMSPRQDWTVFGIELRRSLVVAGRRRRLRSLREPKMHISWWNKKLEFVKRMIAWEQELEKLPE